MTTFKRKNAMRIFGFDDDQFRIDSVFSQLMSATQGWASGFSDRSAQRKWSVLRIDRGVRRVQIRNSRHGCRKHSGVARERPGGGGQGRTGLERDARCEVSEFRIDLLHTNTQTLRARAMPSLPLFSLMLTNYSNGAPEVLRVPCPGNETVAAISVWEAGH